MLLNMPHQTDVELFSPTPRWQMLSDPTMSEYKVQLWICQLETTIAEISGNKWLKLKYHLAQARASNKAGIVTFGGAFSNHLCAVAASCKLLGLQSLAYVRTEALDLNNPTLAFCRQMGMQLQAIDRATYRRRADSDFLQQLQTLHPHLLLVPEGGSSEHGAQGVAELDLATTPAGPADMIICATASGGTLAGIINRHHCSVLGIAVVKDISLPHKVQQLINTERPIPNWQVNLDYAGKGYGRFDAELLQFCGTMARQNVYVEPVYTGKALAALFDLVKSGAVPAGSRLSFFHTGGLQGLKGLYYRGLITATDLALLSGSTVD
jgi:1-aminocyclopropane-1-carboxylate deaminase